MEHQEQPTLVKKISITRNALHYSFTVGGILIAFSIISYILGISRQNPIQYLSLVILIAGIILGILNYRKKINGGFISYGQSLGTGVLIGLFSSILLAIYSFLFLTFIDTGYINEILRNAEEQMVQRNPQMTQEQIDIGLHYAEMFSQPWILSLLMILWMTFISLIASLIISIFTQKKDTSFESNFN